MKKLLLLLVAAMLTTATAVAQSAKQKGYVVVTDYVKANGKRDVSDILQKIIDDNPNRTIYFPDGLYLISKPICTPAAFPPPDSSCIPPFHNPMLYFFSFQVFFPAKLQKKQRIF